MPSIEGKQKKFQSAIKSIQGKLFQPTQKQKRHNSEAKPGLFASWREFVRSLLNYF
jgi:hypothetical protein